MFVRCIATAFLHYTWISQIFHKSREKPKHSASWWMSVIVPYPSRLQSVLLLQYPVSRSLSYLTLIFIEAGIPQIYHFGQEGLHNILIIDILGPSLEDLFEMCGRRFSVKTVCMAGRKTKRWVLSLFIHICCLFLPLFLQFTRAQTIHEKNLIYRDIKPDNFFVGHPGSRGTKGLLNCKIFPYLLMYVFTSHTCCGLWNG